MSTAAVFVIGDEILHGEIKDENGPWLLQQLGERGIDVRRLGVLPDEPDIIAEELIRFEDCDYRLTTGGLGPTHDDRTLEAVGRAVDRPLVEDDDFIEILRNEHGTLNDAQREMARRPEGGEFVHREDSIGIGFRIENIFVFPGFPDLLRPLFYQLENRFEGTPLSTQSIETSGWESDIAELLEDIQDDYPDLQFGSYPHTDGSITIKIRGRDADVVGEATEELREAL
jgi:molybdenum cofactor synthesis domain-containing protein